MRGDVGRPCVVALLYLEGIIRLDNNAHFSREVLAVPIRLGH